MLEVDAAQRLILEHATPLPTARVPLAQARGQILAEPIASDVDSPPHDKSIVDGYAVRAEDLATGSAELHIIEEVTAGQVPTQTVVPGTATRIMTGAPLPQGAEAVVMVEETTPAQRASGETSVRIQTSRFRMGQNIMRQATSMRRGQQVLEAGRELRPIEIGLLAEVGRAEVLVYWRPTVAVLATGNELVAAESIPAAGQIRNSNGPMLAALVSRAGGNPVELGIARDNEQDLTAFVSRGLEADVLVLSGGVSAGVLDLVPAVLAKLGVQQVFHKVNVKPGKPLWFGVLPTETGTKLVFGLPGNPVSTLVGFELFVRPALGRLLGRTSSLPEPQRARLTSEFEHRGERPTYHPACIAPGAGNQGSDLPAVNLLDWRGSADLCTLSRADCLVHFLAGEKKYAPHDVVEVYALS